MMKITFNARILLALLMLIFIGQSSASIAMSCTMVMSETQVVIEASMANHDTMIHTDNHSAAHSTPNVMNMNDVDHMNMNMDSSTHNASCCLDQCGCVLGSCSAYKVSSDLVLPLALVNTDKIVVLPSNLAKSTFLSYLFKPPIQA